MEPVVSVVTRLLQIGGAASALSIAIGIALLLVLGQEAAGKAVITAGLIILILTPISRVAAALWVLLRQRDYIYAFLSFAVLVILLSGILFGKTK